jgi:hypothetical protein
VAAPLRAYEAASLATLPANFQGFLQGERAHESWFEMRLYSLLERIPW